MFSITNLISLIFDAFRIILVIRIVVDWIRVLNPGYRPKKLMLVVGGVAYTLTDWVIKPLNKWIKPVRVAGSYLDLSILVLFLALGLAQALLAGALGGA